MLTKSSIKEEIARWLPKFVDCQSFCNYLLRLTLLAWLVVKVITYKLWLSNRFFPVVSPFGINFTFPSWLHATLFGGGIILALIIFTFPPKKGFIVALLVTEIASCLLDQMRWQPWEYQYVLTLFVFLINWKRKERILVMLHLMLAATYIYSGLHKFNDGFITVFWQGTILQSLLYLPSSITNNQILLNAGYMLPFTETLGGVLLLFRRFNKAGALILILMHILILAIIGPLGTSYNMSVWPWNVLMITYLFFIFIWYKHRERLLSLTYKPKENLIAMILWVVMPAFNFVGLWPHYFSFGLYSTKAKDVMITVENEKTLSKDLATYFEKVDYDKDCIQCNDVNIIRLNNWSFKEMNTAPFPDDGAYRKIMLLFKQKYPTSNARFYEFYMPFKATKLKELK